MADDAAERARQYDQATNGPELTTEAAARLEAIFKGKSPQDARNLVNEAVYWYAACGELSDLAMAYVLRAFKRIQRRMPADRAFGFKSDKSGRPAKRPVTDNQSTLKPVQVALQRLTERASSLDQEAVTTLDRILAGGDALEAQYLINQAVYWYGTHRQLSEYFVAYVIRAFERIQDGLPADVAFGLKPDRKGPKSFHITAEYRDMFVCMQVAEHLRESKKESGDKGITLAEAFKQASQHKYPQPGSDDPWVKQKPLDVQTIRDIWYQYYPASKRDSLK